MTETPRGAHPQLTVGRTVLEFTPRVWAAGGCATVLILILTAANNWNVWLGVGFGTATVLGSIIGVLLQPAKAAPDHQQHARSAVQRLSFAIDPVMDAQSVISSLATEVEDVLHQARLLGASGDLDRAQQMLGLAAVDWETVAPGVAAEVLAERALGHRRLRELSRKESID